jgi:hypothetical protein
MFSVEDFMNEFKRRLIQAAFDANLRVSMPTVNREDSTALRLSPWENSPHVLMVSWEEGMGLRMHGHVRAFGLNGDRTDIHDIIGGLWMFHLVASGQAAPSVIDELHEWAVNETYSRNLIIDPVGQAQDGPIPLDDKAVAWASAIFRATAQSSPAIAANFDENYPETYSEKLPKWIPAVAAITGDDIDNGELSIGHRMEGAMWQHFRSFAKKVTVYRLTPANNEVVRELLRKHPGEVENASREIREKVELCEYRADLMKRVELAIAVAAAVDQVIGHAPSDPYLVWLNFHIIAVGQASVVEVAWVEQSDDDNEDFDDDDEYE